MALYFHFLSYPLSHLPACFEVLDSIRVSDESIRLNGGGTAPARYVFHLQSCIEQASLVRLGDRAVKGSPFFFWRFDLTFECYRCVAVCRLVITTGGHTRGGVRVRGVPGTGTGCFGATRANPPDPRQPVGYFVMYVERQFSRGRLVISSILNRLSAETGRMVMCLGLLESAGPINDDDMKAVTKLPTIEEQNLAEDKHKSMCKEVAHS
ncbi:hypothetical protein B0H19DRAFT_1077768 [Mycena capillaripes]|nr:hypothetical protein B0H19DRAFT_1077768 [Mycena capillaripes]